MNVLIIEDEQLAAEKMKTFLSELPQEINILEIIPSVTASINWLNNHNSPDLIFMDIQLEDGICFEIFDAISINTPVIFTTAYDQYAVKAFEVNSVDYLLKPIEKDALIKAINKYQRVFESKDYSPDSIQQLLKKLDRNYKERFFVKVGNHFHSISVSEIDCFFIRDKGTFLLDKKGKMFAMDFSLDQIHKLIDPGLFYRINRNYIINLNAIEDIYSYSSSRLGLKIKNVNHLDLIVSREKVSDFKEWLDR